jgi:hypothetical protein
MVNGEWKIVEIGSQKTGTNAIVGFPVCLIRPVNDKIQHVTLDIDSILQGRNMTIQLEAFSRILIDEEFKYSKWNLLDSHQIRLEFHKHWPR